MALIPGSGRSPGGGHGNPLQYSCLENPLDRGACQATVHRVAESQTQLKELSTAHTTQCEKQTQNLVAFFLKHIYYFLLFGKIRRAQMCS